MKSFFFKCKKSHEACLKILLQSPSIVCNTWLQNVCDSRWRKHDCCLQAHLNITWHLPHACQISQQTSDEHSTLGLNLLKSLAFETYDDLQIFFLIPKQTHRHRQLLFKEFHRFISSSCSRMWWVWGYLLFSCIYQI